MSITITSFVVWAWLVPPLSSLWKKPVVVVQMHGLLLSFWAIIAQMSRVPADLACHASIQSLKCLRLILVLGIILNLLEEKINLGSEHVCFLENVHAPLVWPESFIALSLDRHCLLDQSCSPVNG